MLHDLDIQNIGRMMITDDWSMKGLHCQYTQFIVSSSFG